MKKQTGCAPGSAVSTLNTKRSVATKASTPSQRMGLCAAFRQLNGGIECDGGGAVNIQVKGLLLATPRRIM